MQKDPASALAQRELAFCSATAARFAEGTQMGPAREGAEKAYAEAMQALGDAEEVSKQQTCVEEVLVWGSELRPVLVLLR